MIPTNPLEQALEAAATEPSARPLFYRLLLESPLFLLDATPGTPRESEKVTLKTGEQVRAECVEIDGIQHTIVFTSVETLRAYVKKEQNYLAMVGRELLTLMRGTHVVLNPGADFGKIILPEEIEATLDGTFGQRLETRVVKKDTQVLLGQPANYPNHITGPLKAFLSCRKHVRAAYLALCAWPDSGEQHLVIGIDTTGDWKALLDSLVPVLSGAAKPNEIVDFLPMDQSSIAVHLRSTQPFYKKKRFGLF